MRWKMMMFMSSVVTFILLSVCGEGWMFENALSYGITLHCVVDGASRIEIVRESLKVDFRSSEYSVDRCDIEVMRSGVKRLKSVPMFDSADERWQQAALGERQIGMKVVSEEEETVSLYVNAFFWAKAYLREGKVYFLKKYGHVWKPVEINNSKGIKWSYERTLVIKNSVSDAELEILWPCHSFKLLEKKQSMPSLHLAPHSVTIVGIKVKEECRGQEGKPKMILNYKKEVADYGGDQITYFKGFPFHDEPVNPFPSYTFSAIRGVNSLVTIGCNGLTTICLESSFTNLSVIIVYGF